jgi:hypothetical protein
VRLSAEIRAEVTPERGQDVLAGRSCLRPGYGHDASQKMADEQGTDVLREPLGRSSHQEEDYLSAGNAPGPGAAQWELGGPINRRVIVSATHASYAAGREGGRR